MKERVPSLVRLLLVGSGFFALLRFMVMPFIALYLHAATGAQPVTVGFVVGLGAMANLVASLLLGPLSDRLGRKPALVAGAFLSALVFVAYGLAHTLWLFALLQVLFGISWALEGPAFQALLTDLTPEPLRVRVFGYSYWTVNLGAAVGPLLGTAAGSGHAALPFLIVGGSAVALAALFTLRLPAAIGRVPVGGGGTRDSMRHLGEGLRSPVLSWFLVASFFGALAYAQIDTNMAQYMGRTYAQGARLYAYMLSANALTVIALQPLLAGWQERRPLVRGVVGGSGIYVVSTALFILDHRWASWILTNVLFTVGEVLISPASQAVVATVAPEDQRATYFTLENLAAGISFSLGPVAGGWALQAGGKGALFGAMSAVNAVALLAYLRAMGRDSRLLSRSGEPMAPP